MSKVIHIVLTGGPSGGKSSAKSHLTKELEARGWRVFFAPEVATLVISGGLREIGELAGREDRTDFLRVQKQITSLQLAFRESFDNLARLSGQNAVVLHDRGVLDNAGYLSAEEFSSVVASLGTTISGATSLYDGVIHLRSAAVTSKDYDGSDYTVANNAARFESAEEAAVLDDKTLRGWSSHPRLAVIGTSSNFAAKLDTVLKTVLSWLGEKGAEERQRKFLLREAPYIYGGPFIGAHSVDITTTYLLDSQGDEQRVRASTYRGTTSFSHTTKHTVTPQLRLEDTKSITKQTYDALMTFADENKNPVTKRRWYLIDGDVCVKVDHVMSPQNEWVAEIDTVSPVPAFLGDVRDVTGDAQFLTSSRARKK